MHKNSKRTYIWDKDIASFTDKYKLDDRGWIHAHNFSEQEIRELLGLILPQRNKLELKKDSGN